MDKTTPIHQHDCDNCKYLITTNKMDMYYCDQGGTGDTIVRRFGSEPEEYGSSGLRLDSINPEVALGMLVAVHEGYLTFGDIMEHSFDSKLPEGETINLRQWAEPLERNRTNIIIDSIYDVANTVDAISSIALFSDGKWLEDDHDYNPKTFQFHYEVGRETLALAHSQFLLADHWYKKEKKEEKKNLLLDEVLADRRGVSTKEAMSVLLEENNKAQLPRVYYHSWITGPQGARFEIFKSNHSTEVINETKKRLRYDQDVVKIYVVDGEPEDYDHKKERLEFYDIEENDNG